MKRVIAALYPRALATSLALPMDVLHGTSQAASAAGRDDGELDFKFAAMTEEPVATVGGLHISPDLLLQDIDHCDMLLLPAMWRNPRPVIKSQTLWLPLLQKLRDQGTRICAVGTGSCLLAEAGLLDGKAATTHWNYFDRFQRSYPKVNLKRRHLITQADNLFCVGSINSIADLMIHVCEEWYGPQVSRAVENQFSPEIRRPFRAHAYQSSEDAAHHDELVLDAQQWLLDHLGESPSIKDLATAMDCAQSTLSRRFKVATGQSPAAYLQSQRLNNARELLRATNLSVGEVAWQVGLHDVSYFTSLFKKHSGLTPARYRASVRGKLFSSNR